MDLPAGLPECSGPVEGEDTTKNGVVCRPVFPNLKSKSTVSAAHFPSHKLTRIMIARRLPTGNRPDTLSSQDWGMV